MPYAAMAPDSTIWYVSPHADPRRGISPHADPCHQLNSSYDLVYKVGGANGGTADLHEFLITPQGTALVPIYDVFPFDLSEFRDFNPENPEDQDPNYIWDCMIQEVDIATGKALFEWRVSDHIALTDTYRAIGPAGTKVDPWDWYHVNSIAKDEVGNYLISARFSHSITYISGKTGEVIWTLGGKANSFLDRSGGLAINFAWQHDARFLPTNTFPSLYSPPEHRPGVSTKLLTLFDNAAQDSNYEYGLTYSRGMLLELTYPTPGYDRAADDISPHFNAWEGDVDVDAVADVTKIRQTNGTNPDYAVRIVKTWDNPKGVRSSSQGGVQVFGSTPDQEPKVLVGYGLNAVFTEFDANGTVLCDAHFGADTSWERGDIQSYRAYKFAWTGLPQTKPSVVLASDRAQIYVSWNGATEVAEWMLQCADLDIEDDSLWEDLLRVNRSGFETAIPMPESSLIGSRFVRVLALDSAGRRLPYGTSLAVDRASLPSDLPAMSPGLPAMASDPLLMESDPPVLVSGLPDMTNALPTNIHHPSALRMFTIFVFGSVLVFVLFELYRRYLFWKTGRPNAGALLWRKSSPAYRLLGDV